MRDNSYDVPAIKFYVANSYNLEKIDSKQVSLIPFDNVEGLSFSEIKQIPLIAIENEIYLLCCIEYNDIDNHMYSRFVIVAFGIELKEQNEAYFNETIEHIFSHFIIKKYDELNDFAKKAANCFLERYRYYSQVEVDKAIQKRKKL